MFDLHKCFLLLNNFPLTNCFDDFSKIYLQRLRLGGLLLLTRRQEEGSKELLLPRSSCLDKGDHQKWGKRKICAPSICAAGSARPPAVQEPLQLHPHVAAALAKVTTSILEYILLFLLQIWCVRHLLSRCVVAHVLSVGLLGLFGGWQTRALV